MENRLRDIFLRKMRIEEPLKSERGRLLSRFKRGGLKEFEYKMLDKMEGISFNQAVSVDPIQRDQLAWTYVGEAWWCRKRKDKKSKRFRYEFARFVAIRNDETCSIIEGIWDSRRHITRQPPEVVELIKGPAICLGCSCYICGYNQHEVSVHCSRRDTGVFVGVAYIKNFEDIKFKYIEDYEKYSKIFSNIEDRSKQRLGRSVNVSMD